MQKLLAALALIPIMVFAQENNLKRVPMNVYCGDTKEVLAIINKFDEKMAWAAKEEDGTLVVLWENQRTKTYTITKTTSKGNITCAISAGETTETM